MGFLRQDESLKTFVFANSWRIFRVPIIAFPDNVVRYILTCVILHNYLRRRDSNYAPRGFVDVYDLQRNLIEGGWRAKENADFTFQSSCRYPTNKWNENWREAKRIRDCLS